MANNKKKRNYRIIFTGGACTGKTTMIKEMAKKGFITVRESARDVIAQEIKYEKDYPGYTGILPWNDLRQFQGKVMRSQMAREKEAAAKLKKRNFVSRLTKGTFLDNLFNSKNKSYNILADKCTVHDRSLVDNLAYLRNEFDIYPGHYEKFIADADYTRIYFLEQLSIYKQDDERKESPEEMKKIHDKIYETYEMLASEYGFEIVRVPPVSIEERTELIMGDLEKTIEKLDGDNDSKTTGLGVSKDRCMEHEGKYKVNLHEVAKKISGEDLIAKDSVIESNHVLYLGNLGLDYIIRLRDNGSKILTVKGKTDSSSGYNSRREYEIKIPESAYKILMKIMPKSYVYHKIRDTYVPADNHDCEICLDLIEGLGEFVEIESSSPEDIAYWKDKLGIESDNIEMSYGQLLKEKGGKK